MSRKKIIIATIIFLSLIIGGFLGFYFYLYNKANKDGTPLPRPSTFFGLFGNKDNPQPATSTPTIITNSNGTPLAVKIPRLRHYTGSPISGADFILKDIYATTTATSTAAASSTKNQIKPKVVAVVELIRWMERGSGNIFEASTSTLRTPRISNTTVSQVEEAFFTDRGDSVITRRLINNTDAIETQYGKLQVLTATSTEQSLEFTKLPLNITSIALAPDKSRVFYITPSDPRGQISRTDGSSKINVFDSPYHEWLSQWPSTTTVILTTKPSGTTAGYSYLLNIQNKSVSKILGNRDGLTTLASPDSSKILFSESVQGASPLSLLDRKTGETRPLFIKTFTDKCVWSSLEKDIVYCAVPDTMPFSTYPDTWYQGLIGFSDNLWKINTLTGENREILHTLDETDSSIDMTNLSLSKNEDHILFRNKNDLSLWGYQLVLPVETITPNATTTRTQ